MGQPNTIFAGTTGPSGDRPGPDTLASRIGMYAAAALLFPIFTVTYGIWMGLYQWGRLRYWIPIAASGPLLIISAIFGAISPQGIANTLGSYAGLFNGITGGGFGEAYLSFILNQLLLGLFLGTFAAGSASIWKWWRRPKYKEMFLTPGPLLKDRVKKTTVDIARGLNSPDDGITLGIAKDLRDERFAGGKPGEKYGNRVVISDAELSGHCFVVGGSGAGKTQTMLVGLRDVIRRGHGVVFIDCKGGPDVPEQIAEWSARYGREFFHWTIQDPRMEYQGPADNGPAFYDPISRGDASRRKDLIIGAMRWDVEYYKSVISNYLQTLFMVKDLVPAPEGTDTFSDVADLLSPAVLLRRARNIVAMNHPELAATLTRLTEMEDTERSGIRNMYSRLHTITSSTAGSWLRTDPEGRRDIDLRRVADEGQVVVFSLDTSNYEETATLIAGLIVQDLKTLSSELRNDPSPNPLHVYVDEFSAVDTTNILGLLNKARDAKMPCTLATQALADLARREPTFTDQVLGIVSCFIIHRANAEADARIYAGLSGVVRKTISRTNVQESSGLLGVMGSASSSGTGFLEEREDYAVPIGAFQELKRGQAIYIAKSPTARYVNPVDVIIEDPAFPDMQRDKALVIEKRYRTGSNSSSPAVTYDYPTDGSLFSPSTKSVEDEPSAPLTVADVAPETATGPVRPGGPRRPGSSSNAAPGTPGGLPISPAPGAGRPAGAPMPSLRPKPTRGGQNDFKPDEWSGIP
jgi:hypothetical protein